MKRVRSKGFTLVEILTAVAILGILVVIVLDLINTYSKKGKDDYNDKLLDQAVVSAKAFYTESKERVPLVDNYDMVSLKELKTGNYLSKDFIDSKNDFCMDESFVTAINEGSIKYYACLKCGNKTYMTDESKCDYDYSKEVDDSEDDQTDSISCKVTSSKTSNGVKTTITASGAKEIWYTDGSEKYMVSGSTVTITKYGYYFFYASDGENTVKCSGYVNYQKPNDKNNDKDADENSDIEYEMYYATKTQYSNKQTTGLVSYDGTEWKSGYAYVKVTNSNDFSSVSPSLDSNGGFWITTEGKKNTTITAKNKSGKEVSVTLTTRLDRTKPVISVTNSSNGSWTNKAVTVKAIATDTHSDIDSLTHKNNVNSVTSWKTITESTKKLTGTIIWKSADRKFTMTIIATDLAGNKATKTTQIKQDITPPKFKDSCYKGTGTVQGGAPAWVWRHKWSDNLSGIKATESRHCYKGNTAVGYDKCSVWPLNGTYNGRYRGWTDRGSTTGSATLTFLMKYKYAPTQTVSHIFKVCDRAGNCTERTSSDTYIPAKSDHCK